ncbi:hypothetical protein EPN87_02490 [archaeon]|nr:MAG: hypothetical protein EPN87_02490 [archaeon]
MRLYDRRGASKTLAAAIIGTGLAVTGLSYLAGRSHVPPERVRTENYTSTVTTESTTTTTLPPTTITSFETRLSTRNVTTTVTQELERLYYCDSLVEDFGNTKIAASEDRRKDPYSGKPVTSYYTYPGTNGLIEGKTKSDLIFYTPTFEDNGGENQIITFPNLFYTQFDGKNALVIDDPVYRKFRGGGIEPNSVTPSIIGIRTPIDIKPDTAGIVYGFVGEPSNNPVTAEVLVNGQSAPSMILPSKLLQYRTDDNGSQLAVIFNSPGAPKIPADTKQITAELKIKTVANPNIIIQYIKEGIGLLFGDSGTFLNLGDLRTLGYCTKPP